MIYLQKDSNRELPHHFDVSCAMYGAMDTGQDFRLITYDDLISGKFNKLVTSNNLFVGSVEFMRVVFQIAGVEDPRLPMNSDRKHSIQTLGEIKRLAQLGQKFFIKPFDIKLFTGFVIDQMQNTSISNVPEETRVMVYDVFDQPIESEWRCYINDHRIEYLANYSGNLYVSIDSSYLEKIIQNNRNTFPSAYTIDIGVLSGGQNVVIEYNDMWAIGNYGLSNDVYVRMLRKRFKELLTK
jgi:hypothetical protein